MRTFSRYLSLGLSFIGGLIILFGCYGLFTRTFLGTQSLWSNDLILMVLVSILWLFCIQVVTEERETSFESIPEALHGRTKSIYRSTIDIISFLCCLALAISGTMSLLDLVDLGLNVSNVLPVPQWIPVLCFVLGMLGSAVAFLYRAVNNIRARGKTRSK